MIAFRPAREPEYYLARENGTFEARNGGKAVAMMGLTAEFKELTFLRLTKGLNPETGSKLTARLKSNRVEAMDVTFTVPKDVSLLIEVTGDERVKAALWDANEYAMSRVEKMGEVRVRKDGQQKDQKTGNLAYSAFYHATTRPVDGKPDPHSHIHNYVYNVTFHKQERSWKALKLHHVNWPRVEKDAHRRLANNLKALGYDVRTKGNAFEVKGIAQDVRDEFSRRHGEIEATKQEKGLKGKSLAYASYPTRKGKAAVGEPMATVREGWVSRLTHEQHDGLKAVVKKSQQRASRGKWRSKLRSYVQGLMRSANMERANDRGLER